MRRVYEVMTNGPLVTVAPQALVADAMRLIGEREVSHLIVMEGATLLGVTCICDLDCAEGCGTIGACMSTPSFVVDADASVFEAVGCMFEHGVSCLPVTRGGCVIGVVTASDLSRCGVLERSPDHCAACGSTDHVRPAGRPDGVGFCLECTRRSEPPEWDDDTGVAG